MRSEFPPQFWRQKIDRVEALLIETNAGVIRNGERIANIERNGGGKSK